MIRGFPRLIGPCLQVTDTSPLQGPGGEIAQSLHLTPHMTAINSKETLRVQPNPKDRPNPTSR